MWKITCFTLALHFRFPTRLIHEPKYASSQTEICLLNRVVGIVTFELWSTQVSWTQISLLPLPHWTTGFIVHASASCSKIDKINGPTRNFRCAAMTKGSNSLDYSYHCYMICEDQLNVPFTFKLKFKEDVIMHWNEYKKLDASYWNSNLLIHQIFSRHTLLTTHSIKVVDC